MGQKYEVTLRVEVNDPQELYDAAIASWEAENPAKYRKPEAVAEDTAHLGVRDEPNIENCLRQLADPGISWAGTEIHDSWAGEEDDGGL